jgi:hypothetical protein
MGIPANPSEALAAGPQHVLDYSCVVFPVLINVITVEYGTDLEQA